MTPAVRIANDLFQRRAKGRVIVLAPDAASVMSLREAIATHWRATISAMGSGIEHRMPDVTPEEYDDVQKRTKEMQAARFVDVGAAATGPLVVEVASRETPPAGRWDIAYVVGAAHSGSLEAGTVVEIAL